jgi:cysteine sulfinate desulfinase/cysteine desulfurase-like protein
MAFYIVSYDLIKKKDYVRMEKGILSIAFKAKKVLFTVWVIESNRTALNLVEALMKHADADDKILVSEINRDSIAWVNIEKDESDWLVSNL